MASLTVNGQSSHLSLAIGATATVAYTLDGIPTMGDGVQTIDAETNLIEMISVGPEEMGVSGSFPWTLNPATYGPHIGTTIAVSMNTDQGAEQVDVTILAAPTAPSSNRLSLGIGLGL